MLPPLLDTGDALKIRGKKFNKVCPTTVQNALKSEVTVREFSKIFWRSMPPNPLEPFLFLNLLQINSAKKNYAWKNVEIW